MTSLGNSLLFISMINSGLTLVLPLLLKLVLSSNLFLRNSHDKPLLLCKRLTLIFFYFNSLCILLSFFTLVYAFIVSDFTLKNIFLNSSTLKPLIYKIAGSWSSHEGSMLLWFSLLQITSCLYLVQINDQPIKYVSISILSTLQLLFSSFIYFTSNPFLVLSFKPAEGLGLNPMLQDIALTIHPPILYLGYVSYVVPFTIACSILANPRKQINLDLYFLNLTKIFTNIGLLFTTLGITLGSWWAYRELGWGGFWFFDPVENISLFPWLAAVTLHHFLIITIKTNRLANWTFILSIATFLLVLFSTFLVRSGLITSIHSFSASPERAVYLFIIFLIISCGSIGVYIKWYYYHFTKTVKNNLFSELHYNNHPKQIGIILGNICFLSALLILICATIYPIIYSLFYDKIVILDTKFFVNNFIVFTIPILFIIAFFQSKNSYKKQLFIVILSLIITYIISFRIVFNEISFLIATASTFLILHIVHYFLVKTDYLKNSLKANNASMILGHFGFALVAFSITINSLLQSEIDFIGKAGESKTFKNLKVTLQNIKFAHRENYYRQIAEFWLEDEKNNITILKPENRLYIIEKTLSQESDIYSYLTHDLYAVLSNIDGDVIHAKIYYRPMINFIWLGSFIIISGFLIGLMQKYSKSIKNINSKFQSESQAESKGT